MSANNAPRAIRIDTIIATVILWHTSFTARNATRVARAWMRKHKGQLGGGSTATISVAVDAGCWHRVSQVGNYQ